MAILTTNKLMQKVANYNESVCNYTILATKCSAIKINQLKYCLIFGNVIIHF